MRSRLAFLTGLILLALLVACAPPAVELPTAVRSTALAQPALERETAPVATQALDLAAPALLPNPLAATNTPEPVPSPGCLDLANEGNVAQTTTLPDPSSLNWQTDSGFRGLAWLTRPVESAEPSPDGRWWLVALLNEYIEAGPNRYALFAVDTRGTRTWQVSLSAQQQYHTAAWLADGRLIWADQGQLYLAGEHGQNRRDLQAPEPVMEAWASKGQALVSGKSSLWRLDLATEKWERVSGLDSLVTMAEWGEWPVSRPQANLSLEPGGSFAALMAAGQVWRIPLGRGQPARKLGEISYPGRGGRIGAPRPLANSPYWYPGEPWMDNSSGESAEVLLDTRDGSLLRLQTLVQSPFHNVTGLQISPGGRWLALLDAGTGHANYVYLAPAASLQDGRVVSGLRVVGWNEQASTALVLEDFLSYFELKQVDLLGGNETPVDSFPHNAEFRSAALPTGQLILEGSRVRRLAGGALQDLGELPFQLDRLDVLEAGPAGQTLFAGAAVEGNAGCQVNYQLYIAAPDAWQVIPPTPTPPEPEYRLPTPGEAAPTAAQP